MRTATRPSSSEVAQLPRIVASRHEDGSGRQLRRHPTGQHGGRHRARALELRTSSFRSALFLKSTKVAAPRPAKGQPKNRRKSGMSEKHGEQVRRSKVTLEARVRLQTLTLGTISRLAAGDVIALPGQERRDGSGACQRHGHVCLRTRPVRRAVYGPRERQHQHRRRDP
jgi:flagellar motor switch/type III secretory pathway protein FliN